VKPSPTKLQQERTMRSESLPTPAPSSQTSAPSPQPDAPPSWTLSPEMARLIIIFAIFGDIFGLGCLLFFYCQDSIWWVVGFALIVLGFFAMAVMVCGFLFALAEERWPWVQVIREIVVFSLRILLSHHHDSSS
jgi:hypothetical protein